MTRHRSNGAPAGKILVGVVVGFGLLILGLLYRAKHKAHDAPGGVVWGVPARSVRVASCVVPHEKGAIERVTRELQSIRPDVVLLQNIDFRHVDAIAADLRMAGPTRPVLFFPLDTPTGPDASRGFAIFSSIDLFERRPIPNPGGGCFGVWAVATIDNRKFMVASIDLTTPPGGGDAEQARQKDLAQLRKDWEAIEPLPPLIVGGHFCGTRPAEGASSSSSSLAVATTRPTTDAGIVCSQQWTVRSTGSVGGEVDWIETDAAAGP